MNRYCATLLLFVLSTLGTGASAQPSSCPQLFASGTTPALLNPALQQKTRALCFEGNAVLHSGITRSPLWSAEHLTREGLAAARQLHRTNNFHEEPALSDDERARLSDFAHSCFDRGHMANSADASTASAQSDTFSLSNMVAQDPANNEGLWEAIESATRKLAVERGELYVVTGPMFLSQKVERLNGRVMVPTHLFKAVYDPRTGAGAAYVSANSPYPAYDVISIADLARRSGIDAFPAMSAQAKQTAMFLPPPGRAHFHARAMPPECARAPDGTLASGAPDSVRSESGHHHVSHGLLKGLLHLVR